MMTHLLRRSSFNHTFAKAKCLRSLTYFPIDDKINALTDAQTKLRQSIFNLAQKELAHIAKEIDSVGTFNGFRDFMKKLGSMGALGVTVDEIYGGTGGSYLDHVLVLEELSRASAAVALSVGAHSNLCINQIFRNGTETQKHKYLPKLCTGEHIGALAMSEAGSGSDVVSMKIKAERKDDHYILNGSKYWITNGPDADVFVVYAKTDFSSKPQHGISAFIVERRFSGFTTGLPLDKVGMRGSHTSELIFDNCKVPKENLLGAENKGVYVLMTGLDYERLVMAGIPLGIMQACCDIAFNYAHQRKQFNNRLANFQLIQAKIADMYTGLSIGRNYVYSVAKSCDNKNISVLDCAALALYCGEKSTQLALDAMQILGGNGYINDYPTGRLLRDAKLCEIGGGTTEIRRLVIAEAITKMYS